MANRAMVNKKPVKSFEDLLRGLHTGSVKKSSSPLMGWTTQETLQLKDALRKHGRHQDLHKMSDHARTKLKTLEEIKKEVDYYTEKILKHPLMTMNLLQLHPDRFAKSKL